MAPEARRSPWLRRLLLVLVAIVAAGVLGVFLISRADGPVFVFAGGPLRSGELVALGDLDWEALDEQHELEMEIVGAGSSRTLWFSVDEGVPYVACDLDCVGGRLARWPQQIEQDDRVVIRIDGKRAEARLVHVPHGTPEYESARAARERKYAGDEGGRAAAETAAHGAVVEVGEVLTGRAAREEPGDRLYRVVPRDAPAASADDARWDALLAEARSAGDARRSQRTVIRHFFRGRRGGVFVDVGAAHYRKGSMTFFLEKELGWSGVAVDALESWAEGYAENRPATRFFAYIVTDHEGAEEPFYRLPGDIGSTASRERADMIEEKFETMAATEIRVPTTTLDSLLDGAGITKIDFLSMDIEGGEPAALAGFDIERFRPQLVGVEAFKTSQQPMQDYFERHGYRRIDEYLEYDPRNWFYTCKRPRDCAPEPNAGAGG